jgi:hypothetical protein
VRNNDKFFEALAKENKTKATAVAMMVAQRKIPNKETEASSGADETN